MRRRASWSGLLLASWALLALPARGEGAAPAAAAAAEPGWSFTAAPYVWFFFIDGNFGAGGQEVPVETNLADAIEHSDSFAALELNFQAQNGPWTILVDPTWMRIGESFSMDSGSDRITGDVTSDFMLLDTMVLREAKRWTFGGASGGAGAEERSASVDLLGGMRTTVISGDLDLKRKPSDPLLDEVEKQFDSTQSWVDPVIGFRAILDLGRLHAIFRGDVGGFTISSDVTSEMWTGVSYDFEMLGLDAYTGVSFRALYDDFDGDDGFLYQTWTYGPVAGMGVRF